MSHASADSLNNAVLSAGLSLALMDDMQRPEAHDSHWGAEPENSHSQAEPLQAEPLVDNALVQQAEASPLVASTLPSETLPSETSPSEVTRSIPQEAESPSLFSGLLATPGVLNSVNRGEAQREPAFHEEQLILYRQRLRLLGLLAMATLPACIAIYAWLLPDVLGQVLPVYSILFGFSLLMRTFVGRVRSLAVLRLITLASYAVFSMGAAVVIALMGDHNALLYSSHNHIILSALLLPFTVWECAVIAIIVIGSLAWAGWMSLPKDQAPVYASYLYLLCTTAVFVLCVSHFQCLLRRRAFDAAFDLVRSNDKLQTLSFMDALTGGYNRRYLEQTLAVEIARAVRFNRPISVMMFDLDNFKAVNDTRGHAAGDEVLREVWQAALGALREVDSAARYGGDEFSIVLPETDETAAYGVAERLQAAICHRLHARFGPTSPEGRVTASIGIITTRPAETGTPTPDYLIDAADERLYEAKRRGKNLITS